ncbi:MAG: S41 family peptidase [Bacteroidia bacterium]|nr:S41 family peptidase [Bacteroidia bacterium]
MMKQRKFLALVLLITVSFSVGFVTHITDNYFEISKNLDIFGKLYREINSFYVDDTDPSRLMRTGIDAMLSSLDPYTNYISEEDVEDFKFMSTGQYGGVGALIGKREDKIIVLEPYEGYPADKAGLKAGDIILKINNEIIKPDRDVAEVRNILRGEKGTEVILTILHPGEEQSHEVKLSRDRIKVDNVPYFGMVNEKVGYISLTGFTQDAGLEVQEATKILKKENPQLTGIILDLRGNPGGRLDEAVNVANVFVSENELIVETRGRIDGTRHVHNAQRSPVDTEIPLAVLVNSRSASASEIVAGSIQDLDRGLIIGQRSFGKGLVQNIRPLSYNTQLKVTTAKYYTPSGRCIQAINYAERNEDGSVARIPDSLKTAFTTRNGRTVYDGGGIEPDIPVDIQKINTITTELSNQNLIFDFATQYVKKNPVIDSPASFAISEETYREFTDFVRTQKFDYQTSAEKQMEKLIETVEKESYSEQLKTTLTELDRKLDLLKDKDLLKHKKEISRLLRQEIVKRYYYKAGEIQTTLKDDADVLSAIKILESPEEYRKKLSGGSK